MKKSLLNLCKLISLLLNFECLLLILKIKRKNETNHMAENKIDTNTRINNYKE